MRSDEQQPLLPSAQTALGVVYFAHAIPDCTSVFAKRCFWLLASCGNFLETADYNGKIEKRFDIAQKLYYPLALGDVIRSIFTSKNVKGSLGLVWMYGQEGWNVITFLHMWSTLPRLYREAKYSAASAFIKWVFFFCKFLCATFILFPATLASIISSTSYAIDLGIQNTWRLSPVTLGAKSILFLDSFAYFLAMFLETVIQMRSLYRSYHKLGQENLLADRSRKLAVLSSRFDISEDKKNRIDFEKTILLANQPNHFFNFLEYEHQMQWKTGLFNVVRDGTCAVGAFFATLSITHLPGNFLLAAIVFYAVSTMMNLYQLSQFGLCRKSFHTDHIHKFFKFLGICENSPREKKYFSTADFCNARLWYQLQPLDTSRDSAASILALSPSQTAVNC